MRRPRADHCSTCRSWSGRIDLLDLLASLSLVKTLALLKALDASVHIAEDEDADNVVSVVKDIVGAAPDEDAVLLRCNVADRVELSGNDLHIETEILVQAVAAGVEKESRHALFVVCVDEPRG